VKNFAAASSPSSAASRHHRPPAQRGEGSELADGGVRVVEFLPGQLRAAEEQVVVRVADAQLGGWHVAEHGPHREHVSPGIRRR
jgi:hypothetical protein